MDASPCIMSAAPSAAPSRTRSSVHFVNRLAGDTEGWRYGYYGRRKAQCERRKGKAQGKRRKEEGGRERRKEQGARSKAKGKRRKEQGCPSLHRSIGRLSIALHRQRVTAIARFATATSNRLRPGGPMRRPGPARLPGFQWSQTMRKAHGTWRTAHVPSMQHGKEFEGLKGMGSWR